MSDICSDTVEIVSCGRIKRPVTLNLYGKLRQDIIDVASKSYTLFGRGAVVVREEDMKMVNEGYSKSVGSAAYIVPTSNCDLPGIGFVKEYMNIYDPNKHVIVCVNSGTSLKCGQIVL